jgi:hypothetical protein
MSAIHTVKCDACGNVANTKYNGEHHLPPQGWVELWDTHTALCTGEHLCPKCRPKKKGKKE